MSNMSAAKDVLKMLGMGPDTHLDPTYGKRLVELSEKPDDLTADELIDVLDAAAFSALASDFVITVLDKVWRGIGGNEEQAKARRAVRGA